MKELISHFATMIHTGPFVYEMQQAPLSSVPFHEDTESITRFFASIFPVHLAVHQVSPVTAPPAEYTREHSHHDSDEINIIISDSLLMYRIHLDGKDMVVANNSAIWIPRNMIHSANVLEGAGFFVTLRVNQDR